MTPLTEREEQILEMVAGDHTYQQIAFTLGVSPNTVKNHMRNIYRKTGAHSKNEAITVWKHMKERTKET